MSVILLLTNEDICNMDQHVNLHVSNKCIKPSFVKVKGVFLVPSVARACSVKSTCNLFVTISKSMRAVSLQQPVYIDMLL